MTFVGYLLQTTYRVGQGRPVWTAFGRLNDGRPFRIRDDRHRPHFFIRHADAATARSLGAAPGASPVRASMTGEPLVRIETRIPQDVPPLRQRLQAAGIVCFEADVRFALRPLIDAGIRSFVEIVAMSPPGPDGETGTGVLFENPALRPASPPAIPLSLLSFDIETDPTAGRLLSVALHGCGVSEVLLLTPAGMTCPADAQPFATERDLIAGFAARVRALDPDILTGWNCVDFDLAVLARLAAKQRVPLPIGRGPGELRLQPSRSYWIAGSASLPGRVVLDGIALLRGAFIKMPSYALDSVAREVLGTGKTLSGKDRAAEILRMFHEERQRFVTYNRTDARLVVEILENLRLIDLTVERSRLTGMPPDRVGGSIAAFEFLYLSELARRGLTGPTLPDRQAARASPEAGDDEEESSPYAMTLGGHVLEPMPGLHESVLVFDFKSLYPSIIRTFQIDPLGHLLASAAKAGAASVDDPIVAPNGARFRRTAGILPGLLDELFPRRDRAKAEGDAVTSQAVKILMNSFYGVMGTPACRFFNADIANAITSFGRDLLLWTKARFEALGHQVLYGDTDSLFVVAARAGEAASPDAGEARRRGAALTAQVNADLAAHVAATWRVKPLLELQFERLYLKLLLLPLRHGTGGARKRYAGLVEGRGGGPPEVSFTGMEVVRRDWTELAKTAQRGLYERLFAGQPVEAFLRELVADLRAGRLDDQLVYRKSLRKSVSAYTETTPPHIAAARKMSRVPRRSVSYIMTTAGPEPAGETVHSPDHEHYVEKQIRPVAEPVLAILGLEFSRIAGDPDQMSLF